MLFNSPYAFNSFLAGYSRSTKGRRRMLKALRRRRRYKRKLRPFGKSKYKRMLKNKPSKKIEVKYSNIVDGSASASCIDGSVNNSEHSSVFIPMIWKAWPSAGTGKQQMIGQKIFIRKLCIRFCMEQTKTNWTTDTTVCNLIKSSNLPSTINEGVITPSTATHSGAYAYGSLITPNLTNQTNLSDRVGLQSGNGKIINKKIMRVNPIEAENEWTYPSAKRTKTYKWTIPIMKTYWKTRGQNQSTQLFNLAEYYLDFVRNGSTTSNPFATGNGGEVFWNYYFTFTDS